MSKLEEFLNELAAFHGEGLFNPWSEYDPVHDISSSAPSIRLLNLRTYLAERIESAEMCLIAEAPGFRGAKFSGIAMCSERFLLENNEDLVSPHPVFNGPKQRTSNSSGAVKIPSSGMIEPTASIVWGRLMGMGISTRSWVNWNALAIHPYKPGEMMSNRTPKECEVTAGLHILELFLKLFSGRRIIAVGNIAANTLDLLGQKADKVRHPANGGASKFAAQFCALRGGLHAETCFIENGWGC